MPTRRIYKSPVPPIHIPTDISISAFLVQFNPDDVPPEKTILTDFLEPRRSLAYGQLRQQAACAAAELIFKLGLTEGDVVCIYGFNSVDWALLAHSVMWAGGYFSAINPQTTKYELSHYFGVSRPAIIAADPELLPNVQYALGQMNPAQLPQVMILSKAGIATLHSDLPQFPLDFLAKSSKSIRPYDLSGRDNKSIPAAMCFSSGTSGKPKGVLLSHYNLIAYLLTGRATNPFLYNTHLREVFFPPFAHIYGMISAVLAPAFVGSHVVAMPKFDFEQYLRRCDTIKATVLRLVPATAIRLTKDPVAETLDLTSVQTIMCSGASLGSETVKNLQTMLRPDSHVLNGYGMSEVAITMLRETTSARKAGSVGKPSANVEIRIVDDDYNDVTPGTDGECLVKGATIFIGYKDNPEETELSFRDGWFCTGDILRVDNEGYFFLTGRKKELIKVKGNQVAPAELEAVLLEHPLVAEAGVCGMIDERSEEIPVGAVTLVESVDKRSRQQVLQAVREFVDERVAPYKRLRGGLFHVDALPKGVTGKLVRRKILAVIDESRNPKPRL